MATKSVLPRHPPTGLENSLSQSLNKNRFGRPPTRKPTPVTNKAAPVAGATRSSGVGSAYSIMASRFANRLADMAESITFVERPKPSKLAAHAVEDNRRPRKLELRLGTDGHDESITFSAPFLDNTLQKLLALQSRMLKSTSNLARSEEVEESLVREHAAHSAELSKIIALICAEKARQGA